jgi:hypothetical protein
MTNDTAQILASCLDAIEQQEWSPEECLAHHPEQRLALSELLPVAQVLRSAPAVIPSLDFRMDARQQLLARLPARRERRAAWASIRVMAAQVGLVLLMVVALATSVVTASARALPNEVLYPVKRTIEQVRLALAADSARGADLRLMFAAERLDEVERLINMGRGVDATVAIDDFATQIQSAVSITQTMPDTTQRAALAARVAESVTSSDAVLSAAEARLPESAQGAVTRARALLAERKDGLYSTQPPATPVIPASATPDRARARPPATSLPGTVPAAMPTLPAARPALIGRPTDLLTRGSTPRPTQQANVRPTKQPSHTLRASPIIPTQVPPVVKPTRLPPLILTFEPLPHFPTPIPRGAWPGSGRQH